MSINAQNDRFVFGVDEFHVISSSLNKKGIRSTFSEQENIYVKYVSDQAIERLLDTKKGEKLGIQLVFPKSDQTHYIYPHFQDDNWTSKELLFALRSDKISNKDIIDLRKQMDELCAAPTFKNGDVKVSLV